MMKAAHRTEYGSPDILKIESLPKPIPKDNEVLIKVYATTVNRTDCANLTGKPLIMHFVVGFFRPKLTTPGTDFAGVIEAVGKDVKSYKVNDKVWGFNDLGLSSQAEYMVFREAGSMGIMPEQLTFEEAAASLEGAHYAYTTINKIKHQAGQKMLINGATGAIGSALLQFAKHEKIIVTAVCNTKNIERIKSLGADKVIDYEKEDFTSTDEKYDFVFDAVGKNTFGNCKRILKPNGIYNSSELGPYAQNIFYALFTPLFKKKKVIFPIPSDINATIDYVQKLIEKKKFKPVIDRSYPLTEIIEAYKYVASGQKTGNVILTMPILTETH